MELGGGSFKSKHRSAPECIEVFSLWVLSCHRCQQEISVFWPHLPRLVCRNFHLHAFSQTSTISGICRENLYFHICSADLYLFHTSPQISQHFTIFLICTFSRLLYLDPYFLLTFLQNSTYLRHFFRNLHFHNSSPEISIVYDNSSFNNLCAGITVLERTGGCYLVPAP